MMSIPVLNLDILVSFRKKSWIYKTINLFSRNDTQNVIPLNFPICHTQFWYERRDPVLSFLLLH